MSLYGELKRRNVFRVGIAYLAGAWLLIEVAGTLFPAFGVPDWAVRFVVIVLALGFLPALIISWAYELTPEGLKREKDVIRDTSITHVTAKRLDGITIGLIIVALTFILADRFWMSPRSAEQSTAPVKVVADHEPTSEPEATEPQYPPNSIAVLPFANRSANPDDAYFVDGIHDDLLTHISKIGAIKTISRTSVMQYRGTSKSIPEIAAELGVATVLEAGIQRMGDQIRINVQLIDTVTDEHIWAETYDRSLTAANVFAVQSEIVETIANQLKANLSPQEAQQLAVIPTENFAAYTSYLKGKQHSDAESVTSLHDAVECFKEAVYLDPDFALAYVGLADAYLTLSANFMGGLSTDESTALAEPPLIKALELDDNLGQAYATLGLLRQQQGNLQAAEDAYKQAISLQPNYSRVFRLYGRLRIRQDQREEALELFQEALTLDPFSAPVNFDIARSYDRSGQFEEAMTGYLRVIEIEPDHAFAYVYIAAIHYLVYGRADESLIWYHKAAENDALSPSLQAAQALAYLELGDTVSAREWVNRGLELGPESFWPVWTSLLLNVYTGDDAAIQRDARTLLKLNPQNWGSLKILRNTDLVAGRYEVARSRYARAFPELTEPEIPDVNASNYTVAVDLALVLMSMGKQEQAGDLLERSLGVIDTLPRLGIDGFKITDVQIFALQQKPQKAIAALRQAIDQGWRFLSWYQLEHEPNLDSIRDQPEFQRLYAELQTNLAKQAKRVQDMKASGEFSSATKDDKTN